MTLLSRSKSHEGLDCGFGNIAMREDKAPTKTANVGAQNTSHNNLTILEAIEAFASPPNVTWRIKPCAVPVILAHHRCQGRVFGTKSLV